MTKIPKNSTLYRTVAFNIFFAAVITFSITTFSLFELMFGLIISGGPATFFAVVSSATIFCITIGSLIQPLLKHLGFEK